MSVSANGYQRPTFSAAHTKSTSKPLPNIARVSYRELDPNAKEHSKRILKMTGAAMSCMIPAFLSEHIHAGLQALTPKIAQKIEPVTIGNGFVGLTLLGLFTTGLINKHYVREHSKRFTLTNVNLKALKKSATTTHQA